jgi:hypothetical protein
MRVRAYLERHPEKKKGKPKPQEFEDLWDRIFKFEQTGCWLWQGSLSQGYGQVSLGGKSYYVHRLVYEQFCGPIPADMELHHLCDNTNCVNPSHLLPVNRTEHRKFHPVPIKLDLSNARRKRDPEHARALDRAKYARRIARDPEGFRAKRRAIEARYRRRKNDLLWGFSKSQSDRIALNIRSQCH